MVDEFTADMNEEDEEAIRAKIEAHFEELGVCPSPRLLSEDVMEIIDRHLRPERPMTGIISSLTPEQKEKALSFTGDDTRPSGNIPWTLPLEQDGRDMSGENLMSMRVAGWRWQTPIPKELQGSEWAYSYASHWSTPRTRDLTVERLFTETDVRTQVETLLDKIDGLESELDSAVAAAWKGGAHEWVGLNYPEHYWKFVGQKDVVR